MNIGFAVAAVIGLAGFVIHVFYGGPKLVRPFLAIEMPRLIKWLFYLCFHVVSLLILTMTVVFGWAARDYHGHPAAAVLAGVAFGCALLSLYVAIRGRLSLLKMVPFWLFFGMSVAAFWGFYGSFADLISHPL
jgi:hypothetical protein